MGEVRDPDRAIQARRLPDGLRPFRASGDQDGPGAGFVIAKWAADSDHPWGHLPFAEGPANGISASHEKPIGVIIKGAHPDFVAATRRAQAELTQEHQT